MTGIILKLIEKKYKETEGGSHRQALGRVSGRVGIAVNLFLFAAKLLAGILSSSIAVIADAFNNLSDAGSSIVTLVGFHLASAPPDKEHPFGHGRWNTSAMAISAIIMFAVSSLQNRQSKF